jgi:hypothetical protein
MSRSIRRPRSASPAPPDPASARSAWVYSVPRCVVSAGDPRQLQRVLISRVVDPVGRRALQNRYFAVVFWRVQEQRKGVLRMRLARVAMNRPKIAALYWRQRDVRASIPAQRTREPVIFRMERER